MSNWKRLSVADLIVDNILFVGDGYRAKIEEFSSSGLPFVRVSNINNGFNFEGVDFFPEEDLYKVGNKVSEPGDVVFTSKGTVGRFAYVKPSIPKFVYSPQLCFWRVLRTDVIHPRFLYYWMSGREFFLQFSGVKGQTDMADYVSLADQRKMHITLPPISEQRFIAGILGALDDKIELNRRMNRTLESMAQAVFRQRFLENDNVNEWDKKSLGDIFAELETGSRPKGGVTQEPVGVPSVGAESIVKIGYFDFSKTKYTSMEFYDSMRRGHIQDRDVLLYKDGGRPGEFEPHVSMFGDCFPFEKFSINEHVYRMRVKTPLTQAYLYFWLESDEIMDEMRRRGTGVAVPGINSSSLSGISISIPPQKLLEEFSTIVEPMVSKIFANAKESRNLAVLRDTLLPKLMNGS